MVPDAKVRRTPGSRDQTQARARVSEDPVRLGHTSRRVRADSDPGSCFICSIAAGERDDHLVLFRDDLWIAFFAKWPTLIGYSLLAPLEHRTATSEASARASTSSSSAGFIASARALRVRAHRAPLRVESRQPPGKRARALASRAASARCAVHRAAVRRTHAPGQPISRRTRNRLQARSRDHPPAQRSEHDAAVGCGRGTEQRRMVRPRCAGATAFRARSEPTPGLPTSARHRSTPTPSPLEPTVTAAQLLAASTRWSGCSIKDSFATLDLAPAGFRVLFDADWIGRAQARQRRRCHDLGTPVADRRRTRRLGSRVGGWRRARRSVSARAPRRSERRRSSPSASVA